MARDTQRLRVSCHRCTAGTGGGYRAFAQGPGTDLDDKARDGKQGTRQDRSGAGVGEGASSATARTRLWKGTSKVCCKSRAKLAKVNPFAALPYEEIGDLMAELRAKDTPASKALQFVILNGSRGGEVIGSRSNNVPPASWGRGGHSEAHLDSACRRMKTDTDHTVPISDAALALLESVKLN